MGENLHDEDIPSMGFFTRSSYLNLNTVLLARHSQYRVETFFQVIFLDSTLGKGKYHAISDCVSGLWESSCAFIFMGVGCTNFKQKKY